MGVFTTQTLLNSVGASRNSSASAAVAINWILKVYFSRSCMSFFYIITPESFISNVLQKYNINPSITWLTHSLLNII